MNTDKTILIVDDDPDVTNLLEVYFSDDGYEVISAHSAAAMRSELAGNNIDLVILDISLPDGNGFDITRELRLQSQVPIIVVSRRSESVDQIVGLELGADDYVTKPLDPRNLLARVRAVLRRSSDSGPAVPSSQRGQNTATLRFGTWQFDPDTYRLVSEKGEETVLSASESAMLQHLVIHADQVLSRDDLMMVITGRNWEYMDRTVDILVARLRKKLEENPLQPKIIKTVRGAGYVLSLPPA
ncbi:MULTISPECIES: response regulator transcription factor [unclassified Labrenzia]|uniref:response regulator n=1 Tax=unclassified Labrenzia TaxID=2648686 RepID=UPI00137676CC|nr:MULTISPECIES: response regulator transcription factor [unclassified Labrenzia]